MAAMRDFFGLKKDQKLAEFGAEIKALSDADKAFFKEGLEQNGYKITHVIPGQV